MSRIYGQSNLQVLESSSTIAATGSISGSVICQGYSFLTGMIYSSMSAAAGAASGLVIEQSSNWGKNWDIISASNAITAVAASAIATCIVGNAVRVSVYNGASAASVFRCTFNLWPV